MTVEQLRKVLEGYGPTREVLFSENGLSRGTFKMCPWLASR